MWTKANAIIVTKEPSKYLFNPFMHNVVKWPNILYVL